MSSITPFDFNGREVRAVEGQDGSAWIVAKDVCEFLELKGDPGQHTRSLDEDEKGLITIQTLGGPQQIAVISESGLYKLTFKSRKPEAKAFTKWVTSEVIPAIRKNGVFYTPAHPHGAQPVELEAAKAYPVFAKAYRAAGLDANTAAISANQAVRKVYNQDILALGGMTHMLSEKQERVLTPTDLGKFLNLSAIGVNKVLVQRGLQFKGPDGIWRPTEAGKPYARLFDTGKAHGSGVPVQQLKWTEDVLKAIQ